MGRKNEATTDSPFPGMLAHFGNSADTNGYCDTAQDMAVRRGTTHDTRRIWPLGQRLEGPAGLLGAFRELNCVKIDEFAATARFRRLDKSAREGYLDAAVHCPMRTVPNSLFPLDFPFSPVYPSVCGVSYTIGVGEIPYHANLR